MLAHPRVGRRYGEEHYPGHAEDRRAGRQPPRAGGGPLRALHPGPVHEELQPARAEGAGVQVLRPRGRPGARDRRVRRQRPGGPAPVPEGPRVAATIECVPTREQITRSPEGRHRPRAAPRHRRARDGPRDRHPGGGIVDVTVSLTTPGCPIKQPLPDRRRQGRRRARGRRARQRRLRRPQRPGEGRACSASSAAPAGCPRARSPRSPTSSASAPARAASASRR